MQRVLGGGETAGPALLRRSGVGAPRRGEEKCRFWQGDSGPEAGGLAWKARRPDGRLSPDYLLVPVYRLTT